MTLDEATAILAALVRERVDFVMITRIACELTELAMALHPWRFEPGVRKFRSLDEAFEHRKAWEKRQVRQRAESVMR